MPNRLLPSILYFARREKQVEDSYHIVDRKKSHCYSTRSLTLSWPERQNG